MPLYLDIPLNNIENAITNISPYPIGGTLAGCSKVILGIMQTVAAIAYGIFNVPNAIIKKNWQPIEHSWTYLKHGIGNIIAGIFEAIPIIQSVLFGIRMLRLHKPASDIQAYIHTGHENKFMPYRSLEERDWKFKGATKRDEDTLKNVFNEKLLQHRNITPRKEMELAQEIIKNYRSW